MLNEYCSENRALCNVAQPGGWVGRNPWARRSKGKPKEGFQVLSAREDSRCKDSRLEGAGGTKGH